MDEEDLNLNASEDNINLLSVIKDPFNTDNISNILISFNKSSFNDKSYWYGKITFKNGNTVGEQRTDNLQSFEEIVIKINEIINSLNKN
jgi:hypothetical protein